MLEVIDLTWIADIIQGDDEDVDLNGDWGLLGLVRACPRRTCPVMSLSLELQRLELEPLE